MARTTPDPTRTLSRLLTVDEFATYLTIPRKTTYFWRTKGTAPAATYVGRHLRFREEDVAAWLDAQETGAA